MKTPFRQQCAVAPCLMLTLGQEWHNGSGLSGGQVVNCKKGVNDPVDPSKPVGSYAVTTDNTVKHTCGSATFEAEVCNAGGTCVFCGAHLGGHDIPNVVVGSSGLQS